MDSPARANASINQELTWVISWFSGLPPQHLGRIRNRPQDQPLDDGVVRAARRPVFNVALHELHLRQATLSGPQPGPGQRIRGVVDADHGAAEAHQVGGHERDVPGAAAYIQHPHAGPDARLGEDHPRRRGHRRALGLQADQLVVTDTGAKLVTGVAITHRVPSLARPATMIRRPAPGGKTAGMQRGGCGGSI
jgi:hypothetical protein